jgi:MFS family permease
VSTSIGLPTLPVAPAAPQLRPTDAERPTASWLGIGLAIGSIIAMPLLGRAKKRIGRRLGSPATAGEGTQNLLCAYMAAGVLAGQAANAAVGWWWLDPVVALGIAAIAVHEGRQTWRGDGCCAASCSPATTNAAPDPQALTSALSRAPRTTPCASSRMRSRCSSPSRLSA